MNRFFLLNRAAGGGRRKRDYSPLSWEQYFENSKDVCISEKTVSFFQPSVLSVIFQTVLLCIYTLGVMHVLQWAMFRLV